MELVDLDNLIALYYDSAELRNLCADLGVDYDIDIGGETRQNKARELIEYSRRHGRFHQLLQLCRQQRPQVKWPDISADSTIAPDISSLPEIPAEGKLLTSRFLISNLNQDLIGRGGMGDVYKGKDIQTGETVAVKILKPEITSGNPQLVKRFIREGEVLRQLNHPNIVKMLSAVEEDGQHSLIMEYMSGGSLADLLEKEGRLPIQRALQIALELADALTRAHHLQIIHRDLKPANVLLAEDDTPRLTDFGVAHLSDRPQLTQTGVMIGTIEYLSPEACNGEKLDARSDIWSFGVMLYEMLVGERPFTAPTLAATLTAILSQPAPDLSRLRPEIEEPLAGLISRMLTRERDQRIASARLIGAELEAIIQGRKPEILQIPRNPSTPSMQSFPAYQVSTSQADSSPNRRNQLILLDKVDKFWIKGVLDKADQDIPLIDISWTHCDEAIDHPWGDIAKSREIQTLSSPELQNTLEAFLETDRSLLILGGPGSGKTITLLKLARNLVALASQDANHPIPVILNLISWAETKGNLADWVVEELTAKYQIPRKMGRTWLENNDLLLLLDALDGLSPKQSPECIHVINKFREEFGLTGITICCRTEEYQRAGSKLKLGGAIELQPLTPTQIDTALAATGPRLASLRNALQTKDDYAELRKMAGTPLMLSTMSATYTNASHIKSETQAEHDPTSGSMDTTSRRRRLFETYVQRMFQHPGGEDYPPDQAHQALSWLAQKMTVHNMPIFLIEKLQPSWLDSQSGKWSYLILVRLIFTFFSGIMVWMAVSVSGMDVVPNVHDLPGLILLNVVLGLLVGLIDGLLLIQRRRENSEPTVHGRWGWRKATVMGMLTTLLTAFLLLPFDVSVEEILLVSLWVGAFFIFMTHDKGQSLRNQIRTVEALAWSWSEAASGFIPGIIIGLIFSIATIIISSTPNLWEIALSSFLPWILVFGMFSGLRGKQLDKSTRPNQGIWLSARNGLRAGILVGLIFGSFFFLLTLYFKISMQPALTMGLLLAMAGFFTYGGSTIEHAVLRFLLWREQNLPWNITQFLDYATGRIFLRKVGGGYIFLHRPLQEYFANWNSQSPNPNSPKTGGP